jgi:hypothetical protein
MPMSWRWPREPPPSLLARARYAWLRVEARWNGHRWFTWRLDMDCPAGELLVALSRWMQELAARGVPQRPAAAMRVRARARAGRPRASRAGPAPAALPWQVRLARWRCWRRVCLLWIWLAGLLMLAGELHAAAVLAAYRYLSCGL